MAFNIDGSVFPWVDKIDPYESLEDVSLYVVIIVVLGTLLISYIAVKRVCGSQLSVRAAFHNVLILSLS